MRGYWRYLALAFSLGVIFVIQLLPAQALSDTPLEAVLKVVQNQDKAKLDGIKILLYPTSSGIATQTVHIFRDAIQARYEYFPSWHHACQEVIFNHHGAYYLKPQKNLILHVPSQSHGPKEQTLLNLAAQNYEWQDEGQSSIAGMLARQVAAVSKQTEAPVLRFWVDEEHKAFLREERYDSEGKLNFVSYFAYLTFPSSLGANLFYIPWEMKIRTFPTPKELQGPKALSAVDFQPIFPKFLPDGFTLLGTYLTEWGKLKKLHLLYSDGLRTISIYENKRHNSYHPMKGSQLISVAHQRVELIEKPEGNLIRFPDGQLTIALVSNISVSALEHVALSLGNANSPTLWARWVLYLKHGFKVLKQYFGIP